GRRLKTLSGLTPYEYVCKIWTSEPERFIINPAHQIPGLNTLCDCGVYIFSYRIRWIFPRRRVASLCVNAATKARLVVKDVLKCQIVISFHSWDVAPL
ncbi:hypothetical protein LOC54_12190, partial [Acetobacter sp. AN02]|nr:hypothetical protein [Acetobacter sp. AN02]